ncbi:MAG: DUF6364 family protein [Clostridiales bacterium]|nr:DUF6364 family protein [Clostridiales bacterium]
MYNKLTLNIDQNIIEKAKQYAKDQKKSVSKLVEDYLSSISSSTVKKTCYDSLGPITKELVGVIRIKGEINYEEILTDVLVKKYI